MSLSTTGDIEVARIPLHLITRDPDQPRRVFDEEKLEELASSIREHGLIQPITVVPFDAKPSDEGMLLHVEYRVLAGERRYRASMLAGAADIPAIIRRDLSADQVAVMQAIENFQRADLTLQETAAICETLVAKLGLEQAADQLGKSKPWVSQRARVSKLPERVLALITAGKLKDVQSAHLLSQILEIDPNLGMWLSRSIFEQYESNDPCVTPPGRVELQAEVIKLRALFDERVKEAKAAEQRAAAQASRPAANQNDADDEGDGESEGPRQLDMRQLRSREESPQEREAREVREARRRFKDQLEQQAEPILRNGIERLCKVLGIDPPRDADTGQIDISEPVDELDLSTTIPWEGSNEPMPKNIEQVKFALTIEVVRHQLEALIAGLESASVPAEPANGHIAGVQKFIAEALDREEGESLPAAAVYSAYEAWSKKAKREPVALAVFAVVMEDAGITQHRTAKGRFYTGVALAAKRKKAVAK